jgi:hypothetical protein
MGGSRGSGSVIGDGSIMSTGQSEHGNWVSVIIYQGLRMISISMFSPQGDPSTAALIWHKTVLAKTGLSARWSSGNDTEAVRSARSLTKMEHMF